MIGTRRKFGPKLLVLENLDLSGEVWRSSIWGLFLSVLVLLICHHTCLVISPIYCFLGYLKCRILGIYYFEMQVITGNKIKTVTLNFIGEGNYFLPTLILFSVSKATNKLLQCINILL